MVSLRFTWLWRWLQVVSAALRLGLDGIAVRDVMSVELDGLSVEGKLQPGKFSVRLESQDLTAHDLCSHGPGVSELLLSRWIKGGSHAYVLLWNAGEM